MKNFNLLLIVSLLFLWACDKPIPPDPEPIPTDDLISPYNANALSQVLIMPAGTQRTNGQPPSASGNNAPIVENQTSSVLSSNGSTAPLYYNYSNVIQNLGGCYVQIDGASSYFTIPYASQSGSNGQLQLPLGIPTNVDEGEFCVRFSIYDVNGRVSNSVLACVTVLRLGTGALQISLTWDTETDQDLYVVTPAGEEISYTNNYDSYNGLLDRDDIDGFGPENVYWEGSAPDGQYNVYVHDYSNNGYINSYFITISAPGVSRSFNGTTQYGNKVFVASFRKSGSSIIF